MSLDPERAEAFVRELRKLTLRHGIAIAGCGCCGSPRLVDLAEWRKFNRGRPKERYRHDDEFERLEWE